MPIDGLTTNVEPRLPLIARFFKGEPKQENARTGKMNAGKELDYFRVEFAPEYAYLAPVFIAKYGEQLRELHNVYLMGSTLDDCFSTWNEEYNAQRLLVRCDGGRKIKEWNEQTQRYDSESGLCDALPRRDENGVLQHPECGCKRVGRLSFMLPEFMAQTGVIGYFLLTTHSFNDIQSLYSVIKFAESQLSATVAGELGGSLSSVPFVLGRVVRGISAPTRDKQTGKIKQIKVNKSLVVMRIESEYLRGLVQSKLAASKTFADVASLPPTTGNYAPSNVHINDDFDFDDLDDVDLAHSQTSTPAAPVYGADQGIRKAATITQRESPPLVKPKDDLGRNAALRNRFVEELKELGYSPKQALDMLGLTSFEGWTRLGILDALDDIVRKDQGRDGLPVNERDDPDESGVGYAGRPTNNALEALEGDDLAF